MGKSTLEEKVLTRGNLLALAVGNVIGGGIMTLTGIAIGVTGRSIVISLLLCSVLVLISSMPQFFAASTIRMNGGFYTQAALFGGKYFGGLYAVLYITFFFGAALTALSFADYVSAFLPGVNMRLVALLVLTVLVALNLLGIKVAAKVQYVIVGLLLLALLSFAGFGIGHVKSGFMQQPGWMLNGFGGVMSAAAIMSFASLGSASMVNFGRQCKNPTRDIPWAILVSSAIVMVIYVLVCFVASGVFPIAHVANQSLAVTAYEVLPYPLYLFFMVFGAMFSLVSSLNALLGWVTAPIVQACEDGWFPRVLGARNKRYHTPHWVLLIIYVLAGAIIISGLNIRNIANLMDFQCNCLQTIICLALIRMPFVIPAAWAKSKFHINNKAYMAICIAGAGISALFCYYLVIELTKGEIIGAAIYIAIAALYPAIRLRMKKQVTIESSYEEA
ncbi:MAG: APC family permease [Clostridia bacterium]